MRRDFEYEIEYLDILSEYHTQSLDLLLSLTSIFSDRVRSAEVLDHQTVDSATEHLLYCVSDRKTPWHLPYRKNFVLLIKVVITHVAKSKCKLAIYSKVDWMTDRLPFGNSMIKHAALQDMQLDALDLIDVLSDQVRRLVGAHGRTKKAIAIFGLVGQQDKVSEFAGSESPLNARLRRARKRKTLSALALSSLGSLAETIMISILQLVGKCVRWGWRTVSANNFILTLLMLSFVLNTILVLMGSSEWWLERRAGKYMSRLGVGSDIILSKSIFLHDLDNAAPLAVVPTEELNPSERMCRDTFNNIMSHSSPGSDFEAFPLPDQSLHSSAALRLQGTRQHLSTKRHDLLVAMRVVNGIDRAVIRAEWENWLMEENKRCQQLNSLLNNNDTGMAEAVRMKLTDWYNGYCASCRLEGSRTSIRPL